MKKFLAITVSLALMLSLCSCMDDSSKESNETTTVETTLETSAEETTTEESEETSETTLVEETEDPLDIDFYNPDGLGGDGGCPIPSTKAIDGVVHIEIDRCTECRETYFYTYPVFEFDTADSEAVNTEISTIISIFDAGDECIYLGTDCFYYQYENVISVVLRLIGDWDMDSYYIWNFDIEKGEVVSNNELLEMSWISEDSIADAASVGCENFINQRTWVEDQDAPLVVDGELNRNHPNYFEYLEELCDGTFSIYNIHDGMPCGIDSEGTLFFVSDVMSFGGADYYQHIYNYDGIEYVFYNYGND